MTVTYPYSLAFLAEILPISAVTWSIKRNDRVSGQGSGRVWQAEMAPPLWTAKVELDEAVYIRDAEQIAARIRKLHGAQESFFLYNPALQYPRSDPKGLVLGNRVVTIAAIGSDRASFSLTGLPAGYQLTDGDKMSLTYGASPTSYGFFEVSEPAISNSQGATNVFGIFPHLPAGVAVGARVTLAKPACLVFIQPESHNPGRANRGLQGGAGFDAMQRKRP